MLKYVWRLFLITIFSLSSLGLSPRIDRVHYTYISATGQLPNPPEMVAEELPNPLLHSVSKLKGIGIDGKRYITIMGKRESGNNYRVVNRFGYIGKYQFSKKTLRTLVKLGYLRATKKEIRNFKNKPELQERAMVALTLHNFDVLRQYGVLQYVGKTISGVYVTVPGILAASHLCGPYAVSDFLKTGSMKPARAGNKVIPKYDGNGISIKEYMKMFV